MVKRQVRAFTRVCGARIAHAFQRVSLQNWLLLVVSAAVLVVLGAWLVGWGLRVRYDFTVLLQGPTEATQKQFNASLEITKAIVGGLGTLATIVGGIILYLNFRVANKNTVLTESRLVTERFSKAVDQLGSDKLEVRLGGIYALERIAQDSARDHWTIMEVLTAFVREQSPVAANTRSQVKRSFVEEALQPEVPKDEPASVTQDVQAALTVIGRREVKNDPEGKFLDLSRSHLSGANLRGAILNGAILRGAKLRDAYLYNADLESADLRGANFSSAILWGAKLRDAYLKGANLSSTYLTSVQGMTEEQLNSANLCQTTLPDGTISDRDCEALGITPPTPRPNSNPP
ncbi:MAG: pentapeptide repeat-containing protein [Stenomitos frigidus ULC029]